MHPRISMVTLGVKNLRRSIMFYKEGMGFPKMNSPEHVAFFTLNGTWLGLYGREELAKDAELKAEGDGFRAISLIHTAENKDEVDLILQQAWEYGANIVKPAQKTDWGGYSGYFEDPDGHLWEVVYNPFFHLGPEDASPN